MHGLYTVKVMCAESFNPFDTFEYTASTHPAVNDTIAMADGSKVYVSSVIHRLKTTRNGTKLYNVLDCVELYVYRH